MAPITLVAELKQGAGAAAQAPGFPLLRLSTD